MSTTSTTVPATSAPRRPLRARWVRVTMPDGRVRLAQTWSPVPAPAHAGRVTLAA
ncbi:MAG TPA: hypothetical protein VK894_10920 [Jiangellales bacterium]|nr:hypothetical protein [Jiangellales bacterium]